jgi:hypothetical protein
MTNQRYGIFEIAKDDTPVGGPFLVGPLDECLACISMAALNENLLATNEQLSAREQILNEREQTFNEQSTQLAHRLADSGTRIVDAFEKARAQSAKRAEAARKAAAQRQVQRYMDELPDPDAPSDPDEPEGQFYSTDPAERQAAMRDEELEGAVPPPVDPTGASIGAVLKDAGLEEEVTTTERTPDPADFGHVPDPKQVNPPVAASFW